jgi:hypothetical protein
MEYLSPLFGQSPVEQDRPHLLGRLVYREVHTDHGTDDVSELCGLQSPYEKEQNVVMPFSLLPLAAPPPRSSERKRIEQRMKKRKYKKTTHG